MRFERYVIAAVFAVIVLSPLTAVLAHYLGSVGVGATAVLSALAAWQGAARLSAFDGVFGRRPIVSALWLVLGLAAALQAERVALFMADGSRTQHSAVPGDRFASTHSCLALYAESEARAARGDPQLYGPLLAAATLDLGRFSYDRDELQYPPAFLIFPGVARALAGDFSTLRALWFALIAAILLYGLFSVPEWIGGAEGDRLRLLIPAIWVAFPTLITLQIGNIHLAVVALCVLALIALDSERPALAGALLGVATAVKLFPALLLVFLVVKRRWTVVFWALGTGLALAAVALIVYGPGPFESFVSERLGGLFSGGAFAPHLEDPVALASNQSPYSLPLKLARLGLPVRAAAPFVGGLYLVALVWVAIALARAGHARPPTRQESLIRWLALINLAALASPFAPQTYAAVGSLWLLTLLSLQLAPRTLHVVGFFALWIVISVFIPLPPQPAMLLSIVGSIAAVALNAWAALRRRA